MANYEVLQDTAFLLVVAEQHKMYKLSVAQGTPDPKSSTKPDKETQGDPNNPKEGCGNPKTCTGH